MHEHMETANWQWCTIYLHLLARPVDPWTPALSCPSTPVIHDTIRAACYRMPLSANTKQTRRSLTIDSVAAPVLSATVARC